MVATGMIRTGRSRTGAERPQRLVGEQTVYTALAAIEQALDRSSTARTKSLRRRELAQIRGVLSTLPFSGFDLEDGLRHLIAILREPILDRRRGGSTAPPPPN